MDPPYLLNIGMPVLVNLTSLSSSSDAIITGTDIKLIMKISYAFIKVSLFFYV